MNREIPFLEVDFSFAGEKVEKVVSISQHFALNFYKHIFAPFIFMVALLKFSSRMEIFMISLKKMFFPRSKSKFGSQPRE